MADLELRKVVKRFGAAEVIHGIDLAIRNGEFIVFVGPSRLRQVDAAPEDCRP